MATECKTCREMIVSGKYCSGRCKKKAKQNTRWKRSGEWKARLGKNKTLMPERAYQASSGLRVEINKGWRSCIETKKGYANRAINFKCLRAKEKRDV